MSEKEHCRAIFLGGDFAKTTVPTKDLEGHSGHGNRFERSSNLNRSVMPARTGSPYVIAGKTQAEAQLLGGYCDTLSPAPQGSAGIPASEPLIAVG